MHIALIFFLFVALLINVINLDCLASDNLEGYLSHLPGNLQLKENGPQTYKFTCDYFYVNTQGDLTRK